MEIKNKERKILNAILLKLCQYRISDNRETLEISDYASRSNFAGFRTTNYLSKQIFALNVDIKARRLIHYLTVLKDDGYVVLELEDDNYSILKCHILENGIVFIENGGYKHWGYKWEEWSLRINTIGGFLGILSVLASLATYLYTRDGQKEIELRQDKLENSIIEIKNGLQKTEVKTFPTEKQNDSTIKR